MAFNYNVNPVDLSAYFRGLQSYDTRQANQLAIEQAEQAALQKEQESQLIQQYLGGDTSVLPQLAGLNQQAAANAININQAVQPQEFDAAAIKQGIVQAVDFAKAGQTDLAAQTLQTIGQSVPEQGRGDINRMIQGLQADPQKFVTTMQGMIGGVEESKTANIKDYEYYQALRQKNPEAAEMFANKSGLTKLDPQQMAEIEIQKSRMKEEDKKRIDRLSGFASNGVGAADGVGNIKRGIELLKSVKTSGINNAMLAGKRFFGIDAADEGELSFLLGKNVLSQLRETFGAAFTAKEGESLKEIEANFSRSPETNTRLLNRALKTAERAAKRGIRAAESVGDDFTANEIKLALEEANKPFDMNAAESQSGETQQPNAPVVSPVLNIEVTPQLMQQLRSRGYTDEEIKQKLGI